MLIIDEEQRIARIANRAHASTVATRSKPTTPAVVRERVSPAHGVDGERRHFERTETASCVGIRRIGGFNFQVTLHNISRQGCRIELIEAAEPGEAIIARLPDLEPISAQICWAESTVAGIEFQRPIHPAVLDSLIERLPAA